MIYSLFLLSCLLLIITLYKIFKDNPIISQFQNIPLYNLKNLSNSEKNKIEKLQKYLNFLIKKHNFSKIEFLIMETKYKSACSTLKSLKENVILIDIRMIRSRTMPELYSIMAHEFYHSKQNHSKIKIYSIYLSIITKHILIFAISGYLFWKHQPSKLDSILLATTIYFMYDFTFNILYKLSYSYYERTQEYNADMFSALECGLCNYEKMSNRFNSSIYKDEKSLFNSHPSWEERLNYVIQKMKNIA